MGVGDFEGFGDGIPLVPRDEQAPVNQGVAFGDLGSAMLTGAAPEAVPAIYVRPKGQSTGPEFVFIRSTAQGDDDPHDDDNPYGDPETVRRNKGRNTASQRHDGEKHTEINRNPPDPKGDQHKNDGGHHGRK